MNDLINPFSNNQVPKYNWNNRFNQEIIGMLLHEHSFLVETLDLIKSSYFLNLSHELICSCILEYFNKHNAIPPIFVIHELIREKTKDDARRLNTIAELQLCLSSFVPGINTRDYCLSKITQFAKEQAFKEAIALSLRLLNNHEDETRWQKIEESFKKALAVDRTVDMGLDYFKDIDLRYERMREQIKHNEVFITGFDDIDVRINHGGLKRGEIAVFLGAPGTGKSNFLCKAAYENLKRGKKVLYLSLEMDQDKLAQRMDAIIANLKMCNIPNIEEIIPDHIGKKSEDIVKYCIDQEFCDAKNRFLTIKQFPSSFLTISGLRSYLSQLNLHGNVIDLLVVDYVSEFKPYEGMKDYDSKQRIMTELRGLAVEQKMCVFTALQPNRTAKDTQENGEMDLDRIADSFGSCRPVDLLASINQTIQEKEFCVGRLFTAKVRDGISKVVSYFGQDEIFAYNIAKEKYLVTMSGGKNKKAEVLEIPKFQKKSEENSDDFARKTMNKLNL